MALYHIRKNFVWRLEALALTCSRGTLRSKLLELTRTPAAQHSGTGRGFDLRRVRQPTDSELTNFRRRYSDHSYELDIHYPPEMTQAAVDEVSSQDGCDVIKELRYPSTWVGYSAAYPSTDIGVRNRYLDSAELIEDDTGWTLRQTWIVTALEIEHA